MSATAAAAWAGLQPVYALFELHFVFAGLAVLAAGASMPRDQPTLVRPASDPA